MYIDEASLLRRLSARIFDTALFSGISFVAYCALVWEREDLKEILKWTWLLAPALITLGVVLETLSLALFRATPGKLIFRLCVTGRASSRCAASELLKRMFVFWVTGLGCGIYVVWPILTFWQISRITNRELTLWDETSNTRVRLNYQSQGTFSRKPASQGFRDPPTATSRPALVPMASSSQTTHTRKAELGDILINVFFNPLYFTPIFIVIALVLPSNFVYGILAVWGTVVTIGIIIAALGGFGAELWDRRRGDPDL